MIYPDLQHPLLDLFLLGVIAASSVFATLFFLRFWRETGDGFFAAFAVFFIIQAVITTTSLFLDHPNGFAGGKFLIRLLSLLVVVAAILRKNFESPR